MATQTSRGRPTWRSVIPQRRKPTRRWSLDDESVVAWDHVPGAQPVITNREAEVLERVVDNGLPDEENPIPSGEGEYRAADREFREDFKPYEVVQPEGNS